MKQVFMLLALCVAAPVAAAELGDPAPALSIGEWMQGGPVAIQPDGTNIYV
ncbi:hypothetical protein GX586_08770, partial [bacterium]|nr:hypothetical protein [bacterium]